MEAHTQALKFEDRVRRALGLRLIAKWNTRGTGGGEFTAGAAVSNDASRTASFVEGDSIGEVLNGVPFSLS